MAGITTGGARSGAVHGTGYSTYNLAGMEIDALVSLAAKGGVGSTIEAIVKLVQPVMWVSTGTAGKIFCVIDASQQTAASMQVDIRDLGTVDSIDLSNATVTARDLDEFVAT